MPDSTIFVGFVATLLTIFLFDRLLRAARNFARLPLPPGPKGLPFVGNVRDLPKQDTFEAVHWAKFGELYGPISSINVLGKTIIVVNDAKTAIDMLEKQSTYSSRPQFYFTGEIVGWGDTTVSLSYNEKLRSHRKNFARIIGTKSSTAQYHAMQEAEVAHFLLHLLDDPDNLRDHIKRQAGSVILKVVYGYNAEQVQRDPLIDMIQQCLDDLAASSNPGQYWVDVLPILRHVPDWVPGTGWKRLARKWASELNTAIELPYAFVEHQMAEGRRNLSFVANLISSSSNTAEETHSNKWSSATLYSGGADTTVSTVACFFLAMTQYPDVQAKAQAEIDRVVGTGRLPVIGDRDNLPYVEAIVKETLRWHTVLPLCVPHTREEETTYGGYRIPGGALILPNVWSFTHDSSIYRDPEVFRPERHLSIESNQPEMDPRKFVFGFGRRVCPGRVFAENTLFLDFAQSLAVFNFEKPIVNGQVMEQKLDSMPGTISHVGAYETRIRPRSAQHEGMVRSLEKKYPWQNSDRGTLNRLRIPAVVMPV